MLDENDNASNFVSEPSIYLATEVEWKGREKKCILFVRNKLIRDFNVYFISMECNFPQYILELKIILFKIRAYIKRRHIVIGFGIFEAIDDEWERCAALVV